MKKVSKLMLATLVATLFLSACEPKEQKLYIVSTNDMHANIDNFPKMAALIDSLRSVHPDLLLFSAGDNRSGNPINDRYTEPAKPILSATTSGMAAPLPCAMCWAGPSSPLFVPTSLSMTPCRCPT